YVDLGQVELRVKQMKSNIIDGIGRIRQDDNASFTLFIKSDERVITTRLTVVPDKFRAMPQVDMPAQTNLHVWSACWTAGLLRKIHRGSQRGLSKAHV